MERGPNTWQVRLGVDYDSRGHGCHPLYARAKYACKRYVTKNSCFDWPKRQFSRMRQIGFQSLPEPWKISASTFHTKIAAIQFRLTLHNSHLCGTSIHHRRGEDGQDGQLGVQHSAVKDCFVLLHAHCQWDIVVLCPAACIKEKRIWRLATFLWRV